MRRTLCALLAVILCVSGFSVTTAAQPKGKLDGEISRDSAQLYHGVTLTQYVLGSSSSYKLQAFSTVEFDPRQDDLYFDVTCGGDYANKLVRTTDTAKRFDQADNGKTVIAAINGDMWLTTSTHSRVEGKGTSYMGYSDPVVTKGLTIPRGFSMYDGEIICTNNMVQETPYNGEFQSFGIAADGEPLLGEIACTVTVKNRDTGKKVNADGINRLPANDALVMYTDKGYASNYALSDAYEVVIDCDYDYVLRAGAAAGINGTVTHITKPGEEKQPMKQNRIILTARGTKLPLLYGFKAGDHVSISTSITDRWGNTAKWETVENCVGGHMPCIVDGVSTGLAEDTCYPMSMLGIKNDGKVVMITSYGRQGSSGYSYGFRIRDLDELCADLGIKTAFLLDGGGSADMAVTDGNGGFTITGRPSDGSERAVVNSVILSYGQPKSGGESADFVFDDTAKTNILLRSEGISAKLMGYSLRLLATGTVDPNAEFSVLGADTGSCQHITITLRAMGEQPQTMRLGLFFAVGDTYTSTYNRYKQVEFDSTGEWQTLVIRLSDIDAWYGRIYGFKLVLFDGDETVRKAGVSLASIRTFRTRTAAERYAADPTTLGDLVPGDVNFDGGVDLRDAARLAKALAGWEVAYDHTVSDYDSDGGITTKDITAMLKKLAS